MNYKQLITQLKNKKVAPVYLLFGEEKFIIDTALSNILKVTVDESVKDFNFDLLYARDVDSGKILDIASAYPMMAQQRTVVVKDVNKMTPTNLNALAKYASSPVKTTCLILIASVASSLGKGFTSLKKNAVTVECKPLYDNQIPAWITQYVKERKCTISSGAIQTLHAFVGNSLTNLANELEKIFLNIGEKSCIDANDIQGVVGFTRRFNIFHLIDSIGNRQMGRSIQIISELLEHGENPTTMLIRLTQYFVTLLKLKELQKHRQSDNDLAKTIGINPYFLKNYKAQARNYTEHQIELIFQYLLESDTHLKTSYQTSKLILELLLFKIIGAK